MIQPTADVADDGLVGVHVAQATRQPTPNQANYSIFASSAILSPSSFIFLRPLPILGPSSPIFLRLLPIWGHLGPSWGRLGAVLGRLGAVLEPSWGHLGSQNRPNIAPKPCDGKGVEAQRDDIFMCSGMIFLYVKHSGIIPDPLLNL